MNHQLIKYIKPYQARYINQIDLQSSTAAISAILLGMLFRRGNSSRSLFELELVFWALLFVNLCFVLRWVRAISLIYIDKIQRRILKDEFKPRMVKKAKGHDYAKYDKE